MSKNRAEPARKRPCPVCEQPIMIKPLFSESRSRNYRLQLGVLCALMLIGLLFVYSATMVSDAALAAPLYRQKWMLQLVWYLVGIAAASALCFINYQTLA